MYTTTNVLCSEETSRHQRRGRHGDLYPVTGTRVTCAQRAQLVLSTLWAGQRTRFGPKKRSVFINPRPIGLRHKIASWHVFRQVPLKTGVVAFLQHCLLPFCSPKCIYIQQRIYSFLVLIQRQSTCQRTSVQQGTMQARASINIEFIHRRHWLFLFLIALFLESLSRNLQDLCTH